MEQKYQQNPRSSSKNEKDNDERIRRIADLVWKLLREDLRHDSERRGSLRRN